MVLSYRHPPLVEVVLGVTLRPLPNLDFAALADLRTRWRDEYPLVQEQPPLPPDPVANDAGPPVTVQVGAPPTRLWFLSRDKQRLLQVQHDRLIMNWRAGEGGNPYPRYRSLRASFETRMEDFISFLNERDVAAGGAVRPLAVEVTYNNAISADGERTLPLERVLSTHRSVDSHLGEPTQESISYTFDLSSSDGYRSLVHVTAGSDANQRDAPLTLRLSAHAAVNGGVKDVLAALDLAHDRVVRTFEEITTDAMQSRWEKLT